MLQFFFFFFFFIFLIMSIWCSTFVLHWTRIWFTQAEWFFIIVCFGFIFFIVISAYPNAVERKYSWRIDKLWNIYSSLIWKKIWGAGEDCGLWRWERVLLKLWGWGPVLHTSKLNLNWMAFWHKYLFLFSVSFCFMNLFPIKEMYFKSEITLVTHLKRGRQS